MREMYMQHKKYLLIACQAVEAEAKTALADCPHEVESIFVDIGLHNVGKIKMQAELQRIFDGVPAQGYDAILLGYGLCSYGICDLHAPITLVVPRAHDCVTLFFGSKERYLDYFNAHKGTLFVSSSGSSESSPNGLIYSDEQRDQTYRGYVEQFGEEEADYLMEVLGDPLKDYERLAYIRTGVEAEPGTRELAVAFAEERGWVFDETEGSLDLLRSLLSGQWDEERFLVVPPERSVEPSYDAGIIRLQ